MDELLFEWDSEKNRTNQKKHGVPADICENCGEYYLSETTTGSVLEYSEVVADRGTEVEIMRFAA